MAWGRDKDSKAEDPPKAPEPAPEADPDATQELLTRLEAERNELNDKFLRTLADYQNSQRRALANEREARQQGITSVVLNVLTVLDHFDLALAQDPSKVSAEQIANGVRVIRDELMKALQAHGVGLIAPAANEVFDPNRHKAVMEQQTDAVEPGHVVATLQAGYTLAGAGAERVIRPAMVSLRPS